MNTETLCLGFALFLMPSVYCMDGLAAKPEITAVVHPNAGHVIERAIRILPLRVLCMAVIARKHVYVQPYTNGRKFLNSIDLEHDIENLPNQLPDCVRS